MDGRPYGKLLPRYAGPIVEFLCRHPDATRADLIDFINTTFGVRVSRIALYKFLKKYGLDQVGATTPSTVPVPVLATLQAATPPPTPIEVLPDATPAATPAPPFCSDGTHFAGAFLMLGQPLQWLAAAQQCFTDDYGSLTRGLLTSAFAPIVGLERLWHLDEMEDLGFALLTGGCRCPSRHTVGGWRRHLNWYEVDAFCRRTAPWHLVRRDDAIVSFDEHTIPRWTRKFRIAKGYVTTRNKYMRCEKLFCSYSINAGRFLAVRATPGNWGLSDLAVPLVRQVLDRGQPLSLHALFDAGAGKSDAAVRALWDLAAAESRLDVTLRACRYPHRLQLWKELPSNLFITVAEPGVCVEAPPSGRDTSLTPPHRTGGRPGE